MAHKYDHLREKAIQLRREKHMTLADLVEHLHLPKTTIYEWIKDIPIPRTNKQTESQKRGTQSMQAKYAAMRDEAYQQGLEEAATLYNNPQFVAFVVLYMGEGSKRNRNTVEIGNSDPAIMKFAHKWITKYKTNSIEYRVQCHIDHDEQETKIFWANLLGVRPQEITIIRKSNSNKLSKRQFRLLHGVLSIRAMDTYFRARLQAWIDFVKKQWLDAE